MYILGGIRCAEIGTFAFGVHNEDGPDTPAPNELVRLASPRRTYTQSHFDYVGEVLKAMAESKDKLGGYKIIEQSQFLRHFTAKLEPV